MRCPVLLIALPLLFAAASCGDDVIRASSSSTGGGGHPTTSTSAASAAGALSWCAPISPDSPTGIGFTPAWVTPMGEVPPETVEGPTGATIDAQGNAIILGWFYDTFDIGTGTVLSAPAGEYDGYVAGLSPEGKPLWLSEAANGAFEAVTDSEGLWVASDISDFTIARFGASGAATWTWPIHPYGLPAIAPAAGGGLWVADSFVPPAFDYGSGSLPPGGGAIDDVALLHFDTSGALVSARSVGAAIWPSPPASDHSVELKDIARAPDGGVLVLADILDDNGNALMLVRLDASGDVVWIRRFAPSSGDEDSRLVADQAGNALIVAVSNGEETFDFGCGAVSPAGAGLLYVGADGAPRWSRSWDTNVTFLAAGFDPAGNALLVGQQYGPLDLGGGMLPWPDGATRRAVVLKLSPSGVHLASRSLGDGPDHPVIDALTGAVTPGGELLFAGAYTGTPDLGLASGPLPTATTRTAFVTKLVP